MKRVSRHILISAGFLLIAGFVAATDKSDRHTPESPFTLRVESDSLYVDGAIDNYLRPLVIPLVYKVPEFDYHNDDEKFRQARLKNQRRVILQFTEPVNGYAVRVTLHPDDDFENTGMAEWQFSKGRNTIRINSGFYWDWKDDIQNQTDGEVKYQGESFSVIPFPTMVQGKDSVIIDTPFCFKDIDFDGEEEFCFRNPGWNRFYFGTYKLVSETSAEPMTGHPYHNIVYSHVENCQTVFDYEKRTIHMVEVSGSSVYDHLYGQRDTIRDALDPMQHISGVESNYTGAAGDDDYFEHGKWVRTIKTYYPAGEDYELEADYRSKGDRVFSLRSLKYRYPELDESWHTLYGPDDGEIIDNTLCPVVSRPSYRTSKYLLIALWVLFLLPLVGTIYFAYLAIKKKNPSYWKLSGLTFIIFLGYIGLIIYCILL